MYLCINCFLLNFVQALALQSHSRSEAYKRGRINKQQNIICLVLEG